MIPENLKESWQKVLARCELMFLADNGGGCPDCLAGLTAEEQVRTLRSLGFRSGQFGALDPTDQRSGRESGSRICLPGGTGEAVWVRSIGACTP